MRFLPPDDERVRKTVMAIADHLTIDGLVLRYRVEETDDGLAGEEGTFTICSFWLVSALSEIGEHHLARDLCQKLLGYASPLHLYAEEIDPRSGRHLGNFPQAFTHLALINAVMHVIRADEKLAAGMQPLSRARRAAAGAAARLAATPAAGSSAWAAGGRPGRRQALGAGLLARARVGVQRAALDGLVDQRHELAVLGRDLLVVTRGHGGLEAPEVRLDLRRVVAVLEALALGAIVALDL